MRLEFHVDDRMLKTICMDGGVNALGMYFVLEIFGCETFSTREAQETTWKIEPAM
jgi:hypothetical protein